MKPIIQAHQLAKSYKGFQAVKNVSLQMNKGDIYVLIGLNGAGKTTMIKMLLGMIKPTEGECYIKGEKVIPTNQHIWKDVGYLVETPQSYAELTVEENLDIYRRLHILSNKDIIFQVMDQLRLTRYAHIKAGKLSLGNAQRLGLAKALLHTPDILILDEPVNGLDPAGIVDIRKLLQNLATEQGVTILISSHLLSEVAKIATKIGILHEGRLIQEIKAEQLKHLLHRHLIIHTRDNKTASAKLIKSGYSANINDHGRIEVNEQKAIQRPDKISRLLVQAGCPPIQLTTTEEDLESYFLRIIETKGENM